MATNVVARKKAVADKNLQYNLTITESGTGISRQQAFSTQPQQGECPIRKEGRKQASHATSPNNPPLNYSTGR
jgi:hypothetical protein